MYTQLPVSSGTDLTSGFRLTIRCKVCSHAVKGTFRVTGTLGTEVALAPTLSFALLVDSGLQQDGSSSVAWRKSNVVLGSVVQWMFFFSSIKRECVVGDRGRRRNLSPPFFLSCFFLGVH